MKNLFALNPKVGFPNLSSGPKQWARLPDYTAWDNLGSNLLLPELSRLFSFLIIDLMSGSFQGKVQE